MTLRNIAAGGDGDDDGSDAVFNDELDATLNDDLDAILNDDLDAILKFSTKCRNGSTVNVSSKFFYLR